MAVRTARNEPACKIAAMEAAGIRVAPHPAARAVLIGPDLARVETAALPLSAQSYWIISAQLAAMRLSPSTPYCSQTTEISFSCREGRFLSKFASGFPPSKRANFMIQRGFGPETKITQVAKTRQDRRRRVFPSI
jgi:hypothetical protein